MSDARNIAPLAAVTVAGMAVAAGMLGARLNAVPAPSSPRPELAAPRPHVHASRWARADADPTFGLRVVSCGDSATARAQGDDMAGRVQPGRGATACTVLFAMPWPAGREGRCSITAGAGRVDRVTATDLVVVDVGGPFFYACTEAP